MSTRGGGRGGGGRGNYRGGGGGRNSRGGGNRGGGGRGGPFYHQNKGGGGGNYPKSAFNPCHAFTTGGSCPNGNGCKFAHIVRLHKCVPATPTAQGSNQNAFQQPQHNNNRYRNNNSQGVNAVEIWEAQHGIQIFTGAEDGKWRLWDSMQNFSQVAEQDMHGTVGCLKLASNHLFCGFEAPPKNLPETMVGMVHIWNLQQPTETPKELHMMPPTLISYAHNQRVTALEIVENAGGGPKIISGGMDGSIRVWKFENNQFLFEKSLPGHAREVTGLCLIPGGSLLWSSSKDGSLRIWDLAQPGDIACQHCIEPLPAGQTPNQSSPGHAKAVTALVPFAHEAGMYLLSGSLDGFIKVWDTTSGRPVASENHGEGVASLSLATEARGSQVLLVGLESGNITCRNLLPTPKAAAFSPLFTLSTKYTNAHQGAVRAVTPGPSATFYSGGADGNLMVWQFTGDLGLK